MSPRSTGRRELATNASVLKETKALQDDSMEALERIRRQAAETKELGTETLLALNEQTQRLESAEAQTTRLKSELKKADKLQDRFARHAFKFGNKRRAKKELKEEEKLAAKANQAESTTTTFMRRGPRPKNNGKEEEKLAAASAKANQAESTTTTFKRRGPRPKNNGKENPIVEERNDRPRSRKTKEHGSKVPAKPPSKPKKTKTKTKTKKPKEELLSDQDRRDLRDIDTADAIIDEGIDALGDEVADLLALSKTIGVVADKQNAKLETIDANLETTKTQSKLLNKRMKLFTRK